MSPKVDKTCSSFGPKLSVVRGFQHPLCEVQSFYIWIVQQQPNKWLDKTSVRLQKSDGIQPTTYLLAHHHHLKRKMLNHVCNPRFTPPPVEYLIQMWWKQDPYRPLYPSPVGPIPKKRKKNPQRFLAGVDVRLFHKSIKLSTPSPIHFVSFDCL